MDVVDNIKALPGKGKVFADKLLNNTIFLAPDKVFGAYIDHFGEYTGVQEFYKNYMCLKMKTEYDELVLKDPIEFNKYEEEYKLVE